MNSLFDFPQNVKNLFSSLFLNIEHYEREKDVYDEFLIERENDISHLRARVESIHIHGGNILIVGEPGVGKTIFLNCFRNASKKIFNGKDVVLDHIDLRPLAYDKDDSKTFFNNFRKKLIDVMLSILKLFDDECHETQDLPDVLSIYNHLSLKLQEVNKHIQDESPQKLHFFIVDDVDYLPDDVFGKLLEILRPLLLSHFCCVVCACRVPSYNAIQSHVDYNIKNAFLDSLTIKLEPIHPRVLLKPRFGFLKKYKSIKNLVKAKLAIMKILDLNALLAILKSEELSDIELIDFPFTQSQLNFMVEMSNGSSRQVMEMAKLIFEYMLDNSGKIKLLPSGGYWIGKKAMLKIFTANGVNDRIRIYNLHEKKTNEFLTKNERKKKKLTPNQMGNSKYILILEAYLSMKYPKSYNIDFLKSLELKYGLSLKDIETETPFLVSMRLIRQRHIETRTSIGHIELPKEYDLTKRGYYYHTYLLRWKAYIDEYGISNHHEAYKNFNTKESVKSYLIEFIVNILIIHKRLNKTEDFKISKTVFKDKFNELFKPKLSFLSYNSRIMGYSFEMGENDIIEYVGDAFHIIEMRNIEKHRNYLFYGKEIIKVCSELGFPLEERYIYDEADFENFVKRHVSIPEYQENKLRRGNL